MMTVKKGINPILNYRNTGYLLYDNNENKIIVDLENDCC